MPVKIRTRKIKDGYVSIYFDIHHKGNRRYLYPGIKFKNKPKDIAEREEKKEKEKAAKILAMDFERKLLANEFEIDFSSKTDKDFFEYFHDFINDNKGFVDIRCYISTLNKLKAFTGKEKLFFHELSEGLLQRFAKNLQNSHNGDTPYNYFKKLKRVLKTAVKERYLKADPAVDISCPKKKGLEKEVLSMEEISRLARTDCKNNSVKNAFLFSCLTGLRFCDVSKLKWKQVKDGKLNLIQSKTREPISFPLNEDSVSLLGKLGNPTDFVFNLPTHTGCLKILENWVKQASIDKHITWHCARHSFGTNLIFHGTDILIASKLLGHKSTRHTERYLRIADSQKSEAIKRLPKILK